MKKLSRLKQPEPSPFRKHWVLKEGTVFLNHGSFGACPRNILARQSEIRREMEAEPVQFLWRRYEERLDPARATLARFLGARTKDIVFVNNATTGINAVVRSYPLRRGDEVLTTSHDYNACRNALQQAVWERGCKLVVARMPFPVRSKEELIETVLKAVTRRTRLAMLDHVTSDTALIYPVAELIRALQARGVDVLVDGAHAPGMLALNLRALNPAFYVGNLHKWVCAPKGAAFLWVREEHQAAIQPAVISHGNNRTRAGHSRFQDRFDWAGTLDPSAWLCVPEALAFMGGLLPGGWPELQRRNQELASNARRLLCEQLNVIAPCPAELLGSMATVPLPDRFQRRNQKGKIAREQLRLYDEYQIEVPFSQFGGRRYLRVSAQVYNTLAEYEYLAAAIARLR